ncbi:MAG: hypothetical protein F6K19_29930 [Cyanothece sp. SIO1E1]|nr:hypothetical protein [Cyanothece sp. SIO1E1]
MNGTTAVFLVSDVLLYFYPKTFGDKKATGSLIWDMGVSSEKLLHALREFPGIQVIILPQTLDYIYNVIKAERNDEDANKFIDDLSKLGIGIPNNYLQEAKKYIQDDEILLIELDCIKCHPTRSIIVSHTHNNYPIAPNSPVRAQDIKTFLQALELEKAINTQVDNRDTAPQDASSTTSSTTSTTQLDASPARLGSFQAQIEPSPHLSDKLVQPNSSDPSLDEGNSPIMDAISILLTTMALTSAMSNMMSQFLVGENQQESKLAPLMKLVSKILNDFSTVLPPFSTPEVQDFLLWFDIDPQTLVDSLSGQTNPEPLQATEVEADLTISEDTEDGTVESLAELPLPSSMADLLLSMGEEAELIAEFLQSVLSLSGEGPVKSHLSIRSYVSKSDNNFKDDNFKDEAIQIGELIVAKANKVNEFFRLRSNHLPNPEKSAMLTQFPISDSQLVHRKDDSIAPEGNGETLNHQAQEAQINSDDPIEDGLNDGDLNDSSLHRSGNQPNDESGEGNSSSNVKLSDDNFNSNFSSEVSDSSNLPDDDSNYEDNLDSNSRFSHAIILDSVAPDEPAEALASNQPDANSTSNTSHPNFRLSDSDNDPQQDEESIRSQIYDGFGGQFTFQIQPTGHIRIRNFGGVGEGSTPSNNVDEIDRLAFDGDFFSADHMLLEQMGSDLKITFEGISELEVVLVDFSFNDLDNLPTGEPRPFGNILFNGEESIIDHFDVFNDEWHDRTQVFSPNKVTFLNELDNAIQGFKHSDDVINGLGGNDTLLGLSGNDTLRGGVGNDTLLGDSGNDFLMGNSSDDLLAGGAGNDTLYGGYGRDIFILSSDDGTDTIADFEMGEDRIELGAELSLNQLSFSQSGSNTIITHQDEYIGLVLNTNAADLLNSIILF